MMIIVINPENRRPFESDLAQMYRQRKAVFVDRAGWKIAVVAGMEIDRYDRGDTIYLLAKDQPDGEVLASVRLLATTSPHLMDELFGAAHQDSIPRGPTVWEVSRFCTAPGVREREARHRLLWETICGVIETALLYGVDQVVFAANRALLPLALHCGWEARTLGPTILDGNDQATAVAAAITPSGLWRVRERHKVPVPVTCIPPSTPRRADEREIERVPFAPSASACIDHASAP
jgi:N-acyl-L-homoserine lactone synthetase